MEWLYGHDRGNHSAACFRKQSRKSWYHVGTNWAGLCCVEACGWANWVEWVSRPMHGPGVAWLSGSGTLWFLIHPRVNVER